MDVIPHEQRPTHLDCFAGIAGFTLGFEAEGFRTIGFVEHDPIKQIVLKYWFPEVPILNDVRDTESVRRFCEPFGQVDVLTAGVPCQPASSLGQQRGTADERWLWPATLALVGAVRPRYFVAENPPALIALEGGRAWNGIVSGLVALGYDLLWDVFPAAAVGAGHLRERVLLIAADAQYTGQHGAGQFGRECQEVGRDKHARGNGCDRQTTTDAISKRRAEAGECLPVRAEPAETGCGADVADADRRNDSSQASPHPHGPRLQGHTGDENGSGGGGRMRDDQLPRRVYSKLLPTPNTWDHKPPSEQALSKRKIALGKMGHTPTRPLATIINEKFQASSDESTVPTGGMKLTPEFLCWLQGFPTNWLKPLRDALGIPSSRKSPKSSAAPSTNK